MNKVEFFRKKLNQTQAQLANDIGVTSDYISMIERGARNPGFRLAKKLADHFNTTVDELFYDNESNDIFDNIEN